MRLVDVDELIEYFDGDLEGYDNREYILHMLDSKGRSARVEAIPVEWLKENYGGLQIVRYIMKDWERENETN